MAETESRHTLQEVADRLGVHYMTAYRYVRLGMLPAAKDGRSWYVTADDLAAFIATEPSSTERGDAPWDERYYQRLEAKDAPGAWSVIEAALAAGLAARDAYTSIIVPALRKVGDAWSSGEMTVADEHAASQIVVRTIARLGPLVTTRGLRRGTVVLGSTQSELHSLPLSIVADLLRAERFEVHDLGANLPPDAFAAFVQSIDEPVAIGIGITAPASDDDLVETISALRAVSEAPIFLGGRAVDPTGEAAQQADAIVESMDEAIGWISQRAG